MGKKLEIKQGDRYGNLTIINQVKSYISPKKNKPKRRFECKCDCGNVVSIILADMRSGKTKSCGCIKDNLTSIRNSIHNNTWKDGKRISIPEYNTWRGMKERCSNPNHKAYKDYGGRGIMVCERWINSYVNFLKDMGKKPSNDYSIDRINVNGNYEPSNCKWATKVEQQKNKR
jgi:hypothetical protein